MSNAEEDVVVTLIADTTSAPARHGAFKRLPSTAIRRESNEYNKKRGKCYRRVSSSNYIDDVT